MKRRLLHGTSVFGLLLGALGLVLLARLSDVDAALALLSSAGPSIGWLVVPYTVATAVGALPWALLLPESVRPSWPGVVTSRFATAAVNVVVPTGIVGEPVRLRCVAPGARPLAGVALVWDRALYFAATGLFLLLAAGLAFAAHTARGWRGPALAVSVGYVLAGVALVMLSRWQRLRWVVRRRVSRWMPPTALRSELRPQARMIALSVGLHLLFRLLLSGELWVGSMLLGDPLNASDWLLASAAVVFAGTAAPIVPGQVGVQEAALAAAMLATGNDPNAGLAIGLMVRVRQLVTVPIGLALVGSPLLAPRPLRAS